MLFIFRFHWSRSYETFFFIVNLCHRFIDDPTFYNFTVKPDDTLCLLASFREQTINSRLISSTTLFTSLSHRLVIVHTHSLLFAHSLLQLKKRPRSRRWSTFATVHNSSNVLVPWWYQIMHRYICDSLHSNAWKRSSIICKRRPRRFLPFYLFVFLFHTRSYEALSMDQKLSIRRTLLFWYTDYFPRHQSQAYGKRREKK
jgi:hypothetical protein